MNNKLFISGFKCFVGNEFELKKMTLLTGSNGTGKSSVIQSILLARLALESTHITSRETEYKTTEFEDCPVPLNRGFELSLGTIGDIFNESFQKIIIRLDGDEFTIPLPQELNNETSVKMNLEMKSTTESNVQFWRKREFYYLNAERLGPRHALASNSTNFDHTGHRGEFCAQVLLKNPSFKIEDERLFHNSKSTYLQQQVDAWLDYICPGTSVVPEALGTMSAQIRLRNNEVKNLISAPNIGFGISYSLPIIINGLVAKKGSAFVVENPEAHLHPKGQSNIGFFLAKVAASGVKVIIETHSEHVVNGVRRASLTTSGLEPTDIGIYFFSPQWVKENITPIEILPNGDLSDFPVDFFDQVRQDLLQVLNTNLKK